MVAASPQLVELLSLTDRAAGSSAKVLITGESGVGKDVIARRIHAQSPRHRNEFVAVNCAGVTETLLESELFGHVKGSFTGAYRDKMGKLQLAHRGTIFLDEVGEMSLRMQALLLRFLENGEIQAVGSDSARTVVDVRVISATNRNLQEMIAAGLFREDLYYRLNIIHLHVPPLRERPEDIQPLATHFLARSGRRVTLTAKAWQTLEGYSWPGNVRQLQNVVEQMVWLSASPDTSIDVGQLPPVVRAGVKTGSGSLMPSRERRRQLADELYDAVVTGGYRFWEHIHPLFLNRDLTRHDIRELVRRGLRESRGSYRTLLELFGMPVSDYKKFMNFLTTHECRVDDREFRIARGEASWPLRTVASLLPPLTESRPASSEAVDETESLAS